MCKNNFDKATDNELAIRNFLGKKGVQYNSIGCEAKNVDIKYFICGNPQNPIISKNDNVTVVQGKYGRMELCIPCLSNNAMCYSVFNVEYQDFNWNGKCLEISGKGYGVKPAYTLELR